MMRGNCYRALKYLRSERVLSEFMEASDFTFNEAPMGHRFPEHEFPRELPKQNSELTVDVPKKR